MFFSNTHTANMSNNGQSITPRSSTLAVLFSLLIFGGCASLPQDVARVPTYASAPVSSSPLAQRVEPMVAQHPGLSGFLALGEGIQAFAARIYLVQQAQHTLDVQYYIWHNDLTGNALHAALLQAADRGVRVRILLDDLDTQGKDKMLHTIDAHPNVEVRLYNPFANRERRGLDFIGDTSRVNHRMHNKTLTADNTASIFGGRNIGDEYFDAAEEVGFSDLDAMAIGPVVGEISSMFDLYWNSQWVYPMAAFTPEDPVTEADIAALRNQLDIAMDAIKKADYGKAILKMSAERERPLDDYDFEWGEWVLVYDQPGKVDAQQVTRKTHVAPKLLEAMDRAQSDLIIVSPYFVPGEKFTQKLVDWVDEGVRVRIMTNSLAANDVSLVHAGYMRYREDLVAGGVELYEFKSDKSSYQDTASGQWAGSHSASLHGKFFAFDDQFVFIGSFNLDGRSASLNTECGVYFESPFYATEIADSFDKYARTKGYQVLLDEAGDIEWVTVNKDGSEVIFDKEPDTSFWTRWSTGFLSIVVPESQL
jgi:putative cardiolipin synthase